MSVFFQARLTGDPRQRFLVGTGHPDEGVTHSEMLMTDVVRMSARDGEFADMLAKTLLASMYAEWDEVYRHRLATEIGVPYKRLKSDLMGDLRVLRNLFVHHDSSARDKTLKVLQWPIIEGNKLRITSSMFSEFIDFINNLEVRIE